MDSVELDMSQTPMERQPLMDVGNLSQSAGLSDEKKAPIPVASAVASQVIDLCTEADMTFAFNQTALPLAGNKTKAKVPAKPRVSAPKATTTSKPKPAPKKAKKSKIEAEFDKLTPLEQLDFLKGKAQLLLQLEQGSQIASAEDTIEEAPTTSTATSTNSASTDDMQLCSLRLELGAVLSSEAELRAKERKIRLQIKRVQRKMTLALPPIVVTQKETIPLQALTDALFVSVSSAVCAVSSRTEECGTSVTNTRINCDDNDNIEQLLQTADNPLWRLAQQDAYFESAVGPRLLNVERDAKLLPVSLSLAPASPAAKEKEQQVDSPDSTGTEHATPPSQSPVTLPRMLSTELMSSKAMAIVCAVNEACLNDNAGADADAGTLAVSAEDNNIDIYEVTSSNESDMGNETGNGMDKNHNTYLEMSTTSSIPGIDASEGVSNSSQSKSKHTLNSQPDEHSQKRQKLHNEEISNDVLSAVRAGLFTNNTSNEVAPAASQVVLTQPQCDVHNNSIIDLCSPELQLVQSSNRCTVAATGLNNKHLHIETSTTMNTASMKASEHGSANNSVAHSESTPDCAHCVIHYVPSDYVESSSEEQFLSQSQPVMVNTLRSCLSSRFTYSQQSEVNTASQYVLQSQSQSSHAPITTTNCIVPINTTSTDSTNLDILTSTTLPDFAIMPLSLIKEIVNYYGLKEDTRSKMISLLRAMWCRVHGKKAHSGSTKGTDSAAKTVRVEAVKPSDETQVGIRALKAPRRLPPTATVSSSVLQQQHPSVHDVTATAQNVSVPSQSSKQQLLLSSYLTQSNTTSITAFTNTTTTSAGKATNSLVPYSHAHVISVPTSSSTSITNTSNTDNSAVNTSSKSTTATRFELTVSDLKQYIRNNDTLYQQVLLYTPIELDTLHSNILSTGVYKVSRAKLLEMLDSLAIFVSNTSTSSRNNKTTAAGKAGNGKGKKRKQLSQSSV